MRVAGGVVTDEKVSRRAFLAKSSIAASTVVAGSIADTAHAQEPSQHDDEQSDYDRQSLFAETAAVQHRRRTQKKQRRAAPQPDKALRPSRLRLPAKPVYHPA